MKHSCPETGPYLAKVETLRNSKGLYSSVPTLCMFLISLVFLQLGSVLRIPAALFGCPGAFAPSLITLLPAPARLFAFRRNIYDLAATCLGFGLVWIKIPCFGGFVLYWYGSNFPFGPQMVFGESHLFGWFPEWSPPFKNAF